MLIANYHQISTIKGDKKALITYFNSEKGETNLRNVGFLDNENDIRLNNFIKS